MPRCRGVSDHVERAGAGRSAGVNRPAASARCRASGVCRQGDVDAGIDDPDRVDGYGLGSRRSGGDAGGQVEAGAVHPALDITPLDGPLGEQDLSVASLVQHGVDRAPAARQADRVPG